MKLFKKAKSSYAPVVQMRSVSTHPFGVLKEYIPLDTGVMQLYRMIREAVPVVDAAIIKLIRLTGGLSVKCSNPAVEVKLNEFLRTVNTGRGQMGINSFVDSYLDSMITYGRAVGEIVLTRNRRIAALFCGNVADIEIKEGDNPLDFQLCTWKGNDLRPLPNQELILFTPFNPEAGSPYGVSLLRSMPFLADILLKIYNSLGVNWERAGNVRFAVVYKPQGDVIDKMQARERSKQIAEEWSLAMQSGKNGTVRDFVAVGDVDIKVIGADNQVLDSEVPVRQIIEQLVSRTGIPPFMLGLNWSSTERMSSQQADIMTSEITAIRRSLDPVIERICRLWLQLSGYDCKFEVVWDDINLQDEVEQAQADLYRAQAEKIRAEITEKGGNIIENY